ncbi:MAG: TaqI-like C-terminal specificity domain-containing protein [Candidatus Limimorpha sp.]
MSNGSMLISAATQRNWEKLNTESSERLKRRANKSRSDKFIVPDNYISKDGLESLISQVTECSFSDKDIFFCLCLQKLSFLQSNPNVRKFIAEYNSPVNIDFHIPEDVLRDTNRDWLGFLYQMRIPEGQRNLQGQYYTNYCVVKEMLSGITILPNQTFLDPCCGTGAFLMNSGASSLSQLYGVDNDEIAIMIAKANLIALYPNDPIYPQLFCEDFLEDTVFSYSHIVENRYDYIYTNPPWGICKTSHYSSDVIRSGERSSLFFVKAYGQLKHGGRLSFLMPSSLLKIKVHQDLRSFVMTKTKIENISLFNERFNGVFTDFFSITVSRQDTVVKQSYVVQKDEQFIIIDKHIKGEETDIELNASDEQEILALIEARGYDNLSNSIWALGVVTGDNKNKLKKEKERGYEAIYTGKDIGKYCLKRPSNYILYDRAQLQQCAKDEYYRCPEKLVYKFISKSLCFAYDNSSSLFLNSANILIPCIQGMSIKTVLAFLNSELFSYYYSKKFTDIKILKGNLMTLPFPKVSDQQDADISGLVNRVLEGESQLSDIINDYIFSLYGFSQSIVNKIKKNIYGNIDLSA